jgi:8-amino-7-oxononanoate synthase
MSGHDDWLASEDARRRSAGVRRELRPRPPGSPLLDLSSNDYLGLARDPRVVEAAVDATRRWGVGATGSRLVSGTTELHAQLEATLARFAGAEAALVFASGYVANLGLVQALADLDSLVVSDSANHASVIDACRLSRADVAVAAHKDVAAVDALLAGRTQKRAVVITDSVFSVDGDLAPLSELHRVCRARSALLVVDEAHAFGVVGPRGIGVAELAGIAGEPDVVRTVTLSKSLGSQGGAVLASRAVIEQLVNTARTFIFDTGLALPCVGAALESLRILETEPDLPARARARAADLATALGVDPPDAAVVPIVIGAPDAAVEAAQRCRDAGVVVGCFRPPSVPPGTSRLRITGRADLTDDDVAFAASVILDAVKHGA